MSVKTGQLQQKQSDYPYQYLVENSTNAVIISAPDGQILYANKAAGELFGMPPEELVLRGRSAIVAPEDKTLKKILEEINRTGGFIGEIALTKKDGTRIPVEISASAFTTDESLKRHSVIIRDVTREKEMALILKENELRYRKLFENIKSGVAVYQVKDGGKDFVIKDLNRAGETMLNTRREQIIGKSVFKVWPGIIEFGLIRRFIQVIKSGRPAFFPAALYRDHALSGWFENEVYPLPSGEIVAVFEDVTEQKRARDALIESEKRFRLVTQTVNDGLALVSFAGEILTWNRGAEKISGIKAADVVGKKARSIDWPIIHEDGSKFSFQEFIPVSRMHPGQRLERSIVGIVLPSGNLKWLSVSTTPMFKEKEKTAHVVGVSFSDITSLRNAKGALETQVKIRTRELEEMNGALTVLLQKRDQDIQEMEEKVLSNCETTILPLLNRLKNNLNDSQHLAMINMIEHALSTVVSPFSKQMSDPLNKLTPAEIQITTLIRQGLTNKEIAQILNNSVRTITNHRDNIRRKLNLKNTKINLRSFLSTF